MVEFFLHTSVDDLNELRAMIQIGRHLRRGSIFNDGETWYLIANIDPNSVKEWGGRKLTQLDGLLIGPNGVTLLEIKACPDPFDGSSKTGRWPILGSGSRQKWVKGGSRANPYQQAINARYAWMNFFAAETEQLKDEDRDAKIMWAHLSSCVLFSPSLHPKSAETIPHFGKDSSWFVVKGLNQIDQFAFAALSNLRLSSAERQRLVIDVLGAKPWFELETVIDKKLGEFHIQIKETQKTLVKQILRHDDITIGRSRDCTVQIPKLDEFRYVSRKHIRIESNGESVWLHNESPSNGTFVNNVRLKPDEVVELIGGDSIILGSSPIGGCQISFRKMFGGDQQGTTFETVLA